VNDDSALVEQLSDKVHQAWAAEKQRQGFADHPWSDSCYMVRSKNCSIPKDKHHADMIPYADLAENVKEYDRATVRAVLDAIHQAGYLIVPNMQVPV
jgi:hypothetical protein